MGLIIRHSQGTAKPDFTAAVQPTIESPMQPLLSEFLIGFGRNSRILASHSSQLCYYFLRPVHVAIINIHIKNLMCDIAREDNLLKN